MILLTNDDGIGAAGILELERVCLGMGEEVVVVAPVREMSECSHCVTTKGKLVVERMGERRFAVGGTPADCVRVGLLHVLPELGLGLGLGWGVGTGTRAEREKIWVYSGINAGGNLGADVYISGTVAAAREAAFFGVRAVAFSQYRKGEMEAWRWAVAGGLVRRVVGELATFGALGEGEFWNVNFPWVGEEMESGEWRVDNGGSVGMEVCERSRRALPVKYEGMGDVLEYVKGLYHEREFEVGSDIEVCFGGRVAVSKVGV